MTLERELEESKLKLAKLQYESHKLLDAASAVLQSATFQEAARSVFDIAKELTGATSGYVALLSEDGSENEVLFLDAGGLPCTVDVSLPMPIRGLREIAYRENRPAYDNTFMSSDWVKFMPEGHVILNNVIFGPLVIDGKAEGLIGLANKNSDFTEDDARIVMALSNLVAIGLKKSKIQTELEESQRNLAKSMTELQLYTSLLRHDLSNDLQLIIGEVDMVKSISNENDQLLTKLDSIESAANRMIRFLQLFSKTDKYEDDILRDVLSALVKESQKTYPNAIINLHHHLPEEKIFVQGKSLIPFVFDNLVRNSIQHVGPEVEINIYVTWEPDTITIDFVDNGPGIEVKVASDIFQRSISRTEGGWGLYLCKKIVEGYKGRISLLDQSLYGNGTAIRIELPGSKGRSMERAH